jgi:hypothetical protein
MKVTKRQMQMNWIIRPASGFCEQNDRLPYFTLPAQLLQWYANNRKIRLGSPKINVSQGQIVIKRYVRSD